MNFNLQATGFDRANARFCAQASALAYAPPAGIEEALRPLGFNAFEHINDSVTDTQCFIASDGQILLMAFRGTSSIRDWRTDARVQLVPWLDDQRVHAGFAQAFHGVMHAIQEEIGGLPLPLVICGHSLGGALAGLLAHTMSAHALYTFGQPRIGNAAFAACLDAHTAGRYFRCVNEVDVVPRVPWRLGRYRHAGQEVYIDDFGQLLFDPSWLMKLPADALCVYRDWQQHRLGLFADHSIQDYVARLNI